MTNDDDIRVDEVDPIVDEVRRAREEIFAQYGYDLVAFMKDMQRLTEEAARTGRKVVSLPPRRPQGWTEPAKKAS